MPCKGCDRSNCHRRGHFQAVCFSKTKKATQTFIKEVADLEEVKFLSSVVCGSKADYWTTIVKVNGQETHSKLDTRAAVSIASAKVKAQGLMKLPQILRGTILSVVGSV